MSDDFTDRLSRWSRRKLAARQEKRGETTTEETDEPQLAQPVANNPVVAVEEDSTASAPRDEHQRTEPKDGEESPPLPSIDELDANSDYTAFLNKDVPEALTRAALRKLWLSDPVFANLDGLADYDLDYNVVDKVITAAQSSYKVGRGHVDDDEPQAGDEQTAKTADAETDTAASESSAETQDDRIADTAAARDAENTTSRTVSTADNSDTEARDTAGPDKSGDKTKVSEG